MKINKHIIYSDIEIFVNYNGEPCVYLVSNDKSSQHQVLFNDIQSLAETNENYLLGYLTMRCSSGADLNVSLDVARQIMIKKRWR